VFTRLVIKIFKCVGIARNECVQTRFEITPRLDAVYKKTAFERIDFAFGIYMADVF
jgi:hypothetical protein